MRIAILGGSFNPLHLGHLFLADEVKRVFNYDFVFFIPAWQPPHKILASDVCAQDRLEMLKNAISGINYFKFEDCEMLRKGVSYTIDTVDYLEKKYSGVLEGKIGLIIGDDLVSGFSQWKKADELSERCDIILANRIGLQCIKPIVKTNVYSNDDCDKKTNVCSNDDCDKKTNAFSCDGLPVSVVTGVFPFKHKEIDNAVFPVSSSDIRERIKNGSSWRFLVPESVYRLIKQKKLYGYMENEKEIYVQKTDGNLSDNSEILSLIEKIRKYALVSEKTPRYEHSVRVAETAAQMCRLYGQDSSAGYLAGIAHDICKEMSDSLLVSLASRDGKPIDAIESEKPSLLHGRAAAMLLQTDFGVKDLNVLEAVRNHTFGKPGMSDLAKIIYAADKIEPGRPQVTPEYLQRLFSLPLDSLVASVLCENIDYLEKKGRAVAPISRLFFQSLRAEECQYDKNKLFM